MIELIKKYYKKDFDLSRDEILSLLDKSIEFKKEDQLSWGGHIYTGSLINEVMIQKVSEDTISFSQNAGLGGPFEIMGYCTLDKISNNRTGLILKFQMGIFPIKMPQILSIFFGLLGLTILTFNLGASILSFFFMLLFLLFFLVKRFSVRLILSKFSNALKSDNNWA
jgi:hypothetical protein